MVDGMLPAVLGMIAGVYGVLQTLQRTRPVRVPVRGRPEKRRSAFKVR